MARVYRFRCRTCHRDYAVTAKEDPGSQTCACIDRTANHWWTSGPETPFVPPDTTGMIFGPYNEEKYLRELAERRGVSDPDLDPERLTVRDEEPAEAPAVQLALL